MLKQLKVGILAVALIGFLASCQNANQGVREAARENVTNAVQPATSTTQTPNATPAAPVGPTTVMAFTETTFDFGTVNEGEKVAHTYKFKNTGNEPLILSDAKGSCGCTVPNDWPREAIAPGASGKFTVKFNSRGKKNVVQQTVTVTANTETGKEQVKIKVNVEVPETDAAGTPQASK